MNYRLCVASAVLILNFGSAHADCLSELSAIMDAHKTAGPYHVSMTSHFGGKTMQNEADVILPSSFHMKSAMMEAIMLKSGTWMKIGGKWQTMPGQMTAIMQSNLANGMEQGLKNVKNLKCLGSQTYQNGQFTAYEFDSSGEAMGIKATSHITMYTTDNKPVWMVIDGMAMGKKSNMVQKITFDPSITINPPK